MSEGNGQASASWTLKEHFRLISYSLHSLSHFYNATSAERSGGLGVSARLIAAHFGLCLTSR